MLAGGNQLWIASDPVAVSETTRGSCLHFDGVQYKTCMTLTTPCKYIQRYIQT